MASSSRLRKNPATLFDVFCEVGAGESAGTDPIILQKYPEDFTSEPVLKSVRQFSFPCGLEDEQSEAVQLFSFVLTDQDSTYTFGFCRHTPKSNTCICIL
uniref:UDENN domain-containing protein n=1 Tax=Plectus sambesii TaxID=2011161 RepID=A0A914V9S7_9BILA